MTWSLIPLDDRPCCYRFPQQLARVQLPPRSWLGRFQQPGQSQRLLDWLEQQGPTCSGAIVSVDMICWGGLVASRSPQGELEPAWARLEQLLSWPQRHGRRLLLFQTILRNAPTQVGLPDLELAENLTQLSQDPQNMRLREKIPPAAWDSYWQVRRRNFAVYQHLAQRAQEVEYLVFALDDSKTKGWNLEELTALGPVNSLPGSDETALLLMVRALASERTIQLEWSHPQLAHLQGLYEDRPLAQVLEAHMATAQLEIGPSQQQLWLYGRPPRTPRTPCSRGGSSSPGRCTPPPSTPRSVQQEARQQEPAPVDPDWLARLRLALEAGSRVVLVDLTFANGGDLSLGRALREAGLWPRLAGYAAWNTLGNRIGTALASLTLQPSGNFLAERVADDLLYQADFRWRAADLLGHPGLSLTPEEVTRVEQEVFPALNQELSSYLDQQFQFNLPWGRLFELEMAELT